MSMTQDLRREARQLLTSGQAACVIGYEVGPRERVRPAFIDQEEGVERLVWDQRCTHNLVKYLNDKIESVRKIRLKEGEDTLPKKVAIVVKPCDSRAVNVLLAEGRFSRDEVHLIGVACDGIHEGAGFGRSDDVVLQERCQRCSDRVPVVYDTLIGEPPEVEAVNGFDDIERIEALSPQERMEFWLRHFDRCIRCYACRQACPMCNCPTCLYESDDSLWVGMGIRLSEKRTFHLGRAYHLAGRCVGCNECERVCPMNIPIGLLNRVLAREIERTFQHRAGMAIVPPPLVTILNEEDR
jgi:formate dehydrogenase subunit beta